MSVFGKELVLLTALPEELREELNQTILELDRGALAGVIERIAVEAPDTARGLLALMDDFQLGRIRELMGEKT